MDDLFNNDITRAEEYLSRFKNLRQYYVLGYGMVGYGTLKGNNGLCGSIGFRQLDAQHEIGSLCGIGIQAFYDSDVIIDFKTKQDVINLIRKLEELL